MSEQEARVPTWTVAVVAADDSTENVKLTFSPEFYDSPISEQTSIVRSIIELATDELIGIGETEADRLESELHALKATVENAA